MPTKLKELCEKFPKLARQMSPLDQVASDMFYTDAPNEYVHSTEPPTARHGIEVPHDRHSGHHNEFVPQFTSCGPNEQFLINKLFSPHHRSFSSSEVWAKARPASQGFT